MKKLTIHSTPEERLASSISENTDTLKQLLQGANIVSLQGKQGLQGAKGDKGDSVIGQRGTSGERGTDGRDGKDGKNGKDGLDGNTDTPEEVRDKLKSLKGKDRLPASAIKGLEELRDSVDTMNQVGITAGGGGSIMNFRDSAGASISQYVTDIQFGSGITPTYSSGKITLTATIPAANILAGSFGVGAFTISSQLTALQVILTANAITASGNAATVPVTSKNNIVTNDSAATLTITLTTASAVNMQDVIVQILDFSAVAQTITWVNTENSTVTAPVTSNGSATLPLTVGFKYNSATSKWRCVASA